MGRNVLSEIPLCSHTRLLKLFKFAYPNLRCRVVFQTVSRISNYFPFKDRFPLCLQSGLVYKTIFANCNISYIGKTSRHLQTRVCEHKGISDRTFLPIKVPREKVTAILAHSRSGCYSVDDICIDDFSILACANNDFLLLLKESLCINQHKPQLNVQGRIKNLPLALF